MKFISKPLVLTEDTLGESETESESESKFILIE